MHNLHTMYEKALSLTQIVFAGIADENENLLYRRVVPKMSDFDIIALSVVAESASIDSENLLF